MPHSILSFDSFLCDSEISAANQAEALGFEATSASVTWLRQKGLFPPKEEEGDDDDFMPEW